MSAVEALVEAHRQHRLEWGCIGGVHVHYVPPGRTIGDVLEECTVMGKLQGQIALAGEWVTVECPGGPDCWCLLIDPAPTYRHHHNDQQVWPPLKESDG